MERSLHQIALRAFILGSLGLAGATVLSRAALAQDQGPRQYCAHVVNDDQLRAPPPSLEAALKRLFGIGGRYALQMSYYRCADGKVLLCTVGANLPCGKANRSKAMPPANGWCRDHPNSDFIPMAVTGHDTPYNWRCVGGRAKAEGMIAKIDSRGFFAENWKELR